MITSVEAGTERTWGADGYKENGVYVRPLTEAEQAWVVREVAASVNAGLADSARQSLSDALSLATLYPAPTPEENAIIDAQVATALAGFRDLSSPPADVVALAAAVVSWRATT